MKRKSSIHVRDDLIRISIFTVVALAVMGLLAVQLSGARFADEKTYEAEFTDVSALNSGDGVQIAGVPVGRVNGIDVNRGRPIVRFTADSDIDLPQGVRAAVRYKNLLGDRYLELLPAKGASGSLPAGSRIPSSQTSPALDLDALLGGFQPLFQGLDPGQINQLSGDLIAVLQGQGGTIQQILAQVGSLTNTMADRDQVIGAVVNNLNSVLTTVDKHGEQFSATLTSLQRLVSGLSADRAELGKSFARINALTASFDGLLAEARPSLQGTLDEFNRTVRIVDKNKAELERNLQLLPGFYQRVARAGSYGSFFNFYLCSIRFRLSGADGKPVDTPWIASNEQTDRCEVPK